MKSSHDLLLPQSYPVSAPKTNVHPSRLSSFAWQRLPGGLIQPKEDSSHPSSLRGSSAMSLLLLSCCILNKPRDRARVCKREKRSENSPFIESFPGDWFVRGLKLS